jgi:hypothetical protein
MKFLARTHLAIHLVLLVAIALETSCGPNPKQRDIQAETHFVTMLTNEYQLAASGQFRLSRCTRYNYSSMDGRTMAFLGCMNGTDLAASNLLEELDMKKITRTRETPIQDRGPARRVTWWHPEGYGECDVFAIHLGDGEVRRSMWGYLCQTPTNYIFFVQVMEHY